ncbi:MAG TPA: NAD-dependent epimerase/dehydratase family protein [Bryobacteraceae bacterium]|nr:NAD-dependent epimerase/dehydratase family protein [Bryobacteraceae bacterium]
MRILVTGAQGCIGAWVVKALAERGMEVASYDTDPDPARLRMIAPPELVRRVAREAGSIEDTARLKALVREGGITHIVHLAAVLMPFCQAQPVAGAVVNVIGTLNVFEAARDAGRPVRVAYASSAAVWGPEEAYGGGRLTEDDPLKPSTHYGVFKQANEGNARAFFASDGISSVGLRPWTVFGVGRDRGLTADPSLALRAAVLGQPYQIRVSGKMNMQYVEDVAETFVRCLLAPLEGAWVFNLGGDIVEMDAFVRILERLRPEAAGLVTARGPQVPVAWAMDDTQLHAHVPDIPHTPLEEGMRKTLELFEALRRRGALAANVSKHT